MPEHTEPQKMIQLSEVRTSCWQTTLAIHVHTVMDLSGSDFPRRHGCIHKVSVRHSPRRVADLQYGAT